jgi:hypothetical protein
MDKKPIFTINPHKKAPLFDNPAEANLVIQQLITELGSNNFSTANEELRELLREAGFVNLWFFLKFIAGYSGPYDLLNTELHLDIANFRQSPDCLKPGSKFGAFLPRSSLKSTILTHGAASWEALRNPDIRILITNSVEDRAYDFCKVAFSTFRDNDFTKWLYPEYIIPQKQAKMVLPNRNKNYVEDTWNYKGFGGELAGVHVNLILFDDIVGVEDLDANMVGSMSMERAKRKFETATRSLLVSQTKDRVGLIGTRYSIDDVYENVVQSCKKVVGFTDGNIKPVDGGNWTIYYRKWKEYGKSIFPDAYTEESMRDLLLK